jgi:hypothetical protein
MQKNLFAYTAPGCDMPDFLSINVRDGKTYVTARGAGTTVEVELPPEQLVAMGNAVVEAAE